ncbi:MAG: phosphoribosylglycinamide formyltransferase [Gemmatimonadales bacterium]|nr:MAG: phosphoribosylglycinamide formyltransferase [Gemmatimonadales bacterium]
MPTALFASGRGSNVAALHAHATRARSTRVESPDTLPPDAGLWIPTLVLSDRADAPVLARARALGCDARPIDPADAPALLRLLDEAGIRMVLLAGYLRMIPPEVVAAYRDRILNIHPALLPAFGGKGMYGRRVHEAVLAAGETRTGVTVHLVDEAYDRGDALAREIVPVRPDDDPDRLAARVLEVEHRLYPRVADHLARAIFEGRAPRPLDPLDSTHAPI